ncbi:MAG: transcriptional regulator [Labilithrix sp.]|nr:transcriptional regulator [Labilithrix sp.]
MTKDISGARERWYDDACGMAHALELVGERWALLVVRELMFGPRRFGELRAGLPGISANVLTQRLEGLEREGIVVRRRLPSPANAQVYELTAWGYESEPILQAMGRWAARSPTHDPSRPLSPATLMMSFRTMLDVKRAARVTATFGFRFPDDAFVATVDHGAIHVERGEPARAEVLFVCAPATLAAVVYGGLPLADAEASGLLVLEGSRARAKQLAGLFSLPPKASLGAG